MPEAWILDMIGTIREAARANEMPRLAEHLDDAMLIAASEYHTQAEAGECGAALIEAFPGDCLAH